MDQCGTCAVHGAPDLSGQVCGDLGDDRKADPGKQHDGDGCRQPGRPVKATGYREGRGEGHGQQGEHGDLPGQPFEDHGLPRRQKAGLPPGADRAARIADHAAGQRLVDDLRQIILSDRLPRVDRDAELAGGQFPAEGGEHRLRVQRREGQGQPAPIRFHETAGSLRPVRGPPQERKQTRRDKDLR
jgi:hypothetical protein